MDATTAAVPARPWAKAAACVGYLALAAGGAWLSKASLVPGGFSPWWPPAAFMLALFLVAGPKAYALAVAGRVASIAVVFPDGVVHSTGPVLLRAVLISAAYLAAAELVRRIPAGRDPVSGLAGFLLCGVVVGPVLADIASGLVSLAIDHETWASVWTDSRTFWVGDAVAVVSLAPLVLIVPRSGRELRRLIDTTPRRSLGEAFLQGVALIGVPTVVLTSARPAGGIAYLVLAVLPVVWIAVRHGDLAACVSVALLNLVISWGAARRFGPTSELLQLQTIMLATALTAGYVRAAVKSQHESVVAKAASDARYQSLVAHLPDHVLRLGGDGTVLLSSVETGSPSMTDLDAAITRHLVADHGHEVRHVLRTGESALFAWEVDSDSGVRWLTTRLVAEPADGDGPTLLAVTTDLTVQRAAEQSLDEHRRTDALTGLVNRTEALADIGCRLQGLDQAGGVVGVLAIDLDQFTLLNTTLGPDAGDELLRAAAAAIAELSGSGATAARLDGDEFALMLGPGVSADTVVATADTLVRSLKKTVRLGTHDVYPTASVGVAWADSRSIGPSELLRRADAAVHAGKELGGDRRVVFDEAHLRSPKERHDTRAMVRQALADDRLVVLYQPLVDLVTGTICGAEALVRIRNEDDELIAPCAFLTVAELYGLDVEIGAAVLSKVVAQISAWNAAGGWSPGTIGVNVTARQLADRGFAPSVAALCAAAGISPEQLSFELTETTAVIDLDVTVETIRSLRSLGSRCALDDFGTGYASIAYLRRLPVDIVKIDQTFVARLPGDDDDQTIVTLIAGVATQLGCEMIAEGVETEAQLDALVAIGCKRAQGYLFGHPMLPADLLSLAKAKAKA